MEQEAYSWQTSFIDNDCASKNFSGICPESTDLSQYNYDYDPARSEIVFYLDGTSSEEIVLSAPPSQKESVSYVFSQADQEAITQLIKTSKSVPESSNTTALVAFVSGSIVLRLFKILTNKISNGA